MWVKEKGAVENPVHHETCEEAPQQARTAWLIRNTSDVPAYCLSDGSEQRYRSILECGCNTGHQLISCGGMAGIDIVPDIIHSNSMLWPDRLWICADLTAANVPIPNGTFHTILLPEILEHLPFIDALHLVGMAKAKAGSRVVITIPDGREAEQGKKENFRNWGCGKHKWVLTEERLEILLLACRTSTYKALTQEVTRWKMTWESDGAFVYIRMDKA